MFENSTMLMSTILTLVFGWAVSPGSAAIHYRNLAGSGVECGTSRDQSWSARQGRIMGGAAAEIVDYPYIVSFQKAERGKHYCAGSLVIYKGIFKGFFINMKCLVHTVGLNM